MPQFEAQNFQIPKEPHQGQTLILRSYQAGDEPACLRFIASVAQDSTHTLKYVGMTLSTPEQLLKMWNDCAAHPINSNLAAFLGAQVVGHIRFFQRSPGHPWNRHIAAFGMAVRQSMWGRGIGSLLLRQMELHLRKTEIHRIEAEVRVANGRGSIR